MLSIDDYSTVKEMAERWGITTRMVIHYCDRNLIPGAVKKGTLWLIPTESPKPEDRRSKSYRSKMENQ
jgi:predicted urease superfamily metal-dependent hydrolase